VFTGDILFIGGTPIMWAGPVERWIEACRRIEEMDVETVVPGHGPITDAGGAVEVRGYLEWLHEEARGRFDAGMEAVEAAKDIALGPYADWSDAERIAVNVHTMFRDFAGKETSASTLELFTSMATLREFQTQASD
jgi:cyclase